MSTDAALVVEGNVRRRLSLEAEDLATLPGQIPDVRVLAPDREGAAVRLASVLEQAGIEPDARFITIHAEANYSTSVPLDAVKDHAILIYRLSGSSLPHDKGGPVRFFVPDVAACQTDEVDQCANVKYVQRIVLSSDRGADTRPRSVKQHVELHREETP